MLHGGFVFIQSEEVSSVRMKRSGGNAGEAPERLLLTRSGDSSPDSPVRELVRRRDTGEHQ
jgi:hypothetical protein